MQGGFKVILSAKLGPASIDGHLGFDAIIFIKPRFRFIVGLDFAVSLKAFDVTLCAVAVSMELQGPGEWRAKGSFSFSILWWDVDVDFDESWGSAPAIEEQTTSATQALLGELSNPERLLPEAPVGGDGLVTLAAVAAGPVPLAHPLGRLTVKQRSIPFEVTIDRLGTKRLTEGSIRYDVTSVSIGGRATDATEPVLDHFARGQFMELAESERLNGKSFERLPCGVSIGTTAYKVGDPGVTREASYEEKILEPERGIARFPWALHALGRRALPDHLLDIHVTMGAAAKSVRAATQALASGGPGGAAVVKDLPLVLADPTSLVEVAEMRGAVAGSDAAAHQVAGSRAVVLEAFELVEG